MIRRYGRSRGAGGILRRRDLNRVIIDSLGEGVLVLDRDARVTLMNRAAEHLLGLTSAELLGQPLHETIHFQHPDGTPFPAEECPLVHAARLGRSVEVPEDAFVRKDGTILPVAYTAMPLEIGGEVRGVVVAFRDITLQLRREEVLIESEARYRLLVELSADAILVVDDSDHIRFANPATERIFGYRPEELIGRSLTVLMPQRYHRMYHENLKKHLRTGERTVGWAWTEMPALRKDGQEIIVEFIVGEYRQKGHRTFIGYARDVTGRKRAEAERERLLEEIKSEQARAEKLVEDVRRAVSTLRTLIDTLPVGVVLCDARGEIILANPAANELVGGAITGTAYGPTAGYTLLRLDSTPFPPDELPLPRAVERGEATKDVMILVRYANGTEKILLGAGSPVRDPSGTITGAVAVLQDVTDRVRTEEALRKSEERLAEAQRVAHLGSFDWELIENRVTWSDEVYRLLGLEVGSIVPSYQTFLSYVYPDDRERVRQVVSEALSARQPIDLDHRITRRDGQVRTMHLMGSTVVDQSGRPIRLVGTIQDITERKQTEEERDRLLARERALAEIAEALVREIELTRVVDIVLEQATRVLKAPVVGLWLADPVRRQLHLIASQGMSRETIEKIQHLSYDAPSLSARAAKTRQIQAIEDLRTLEAELPLMREVAAAEKLRSALSIPLESRGRLVGVVTYGFPAPRHFTARELEFDETIADLFAVAIENAQLYREVSDALRLREEFMATVAHELRTPITVIKGRAQLLLKAGARDEATRNGLESIVHHTNQMSRLVDDILTAGRVRPGLATLHPEHLDLSIVTRDLARRAARTATHQTFHIETDGPLPVSADRELIGEVVDRLLEVATSQAPGGGTIAVKARREGDEAVVSITYPGPLVAPERQRHAFEPFYELMPAGHPAYLGLTGLGLYLSKQLIEAHSGRIWFESSPGKGSTFSFSLPLAPDGHART